jgi:protein O-GlcNAc transferase
MNIDEAFRSALQHYQKGNFKQAAFFSEKILKKQPDNVRGLNLLGLIQAQFGEYDSAKRFFEKAIQYAPDNADLFNNMGDLLFSEKRFDDAIFYYKKVLQLRPDFASGYFNIGLALQEKGDIDEALAAYLAALRNDQNLYEAHYNLGIIFSDKGQIDEAIKHYQNALRINPNSAETYYNLGNAYRSKGEPDDAVAYYQKALQLNPDFDKAMNNLGIAFQDKGLIDDAILCFQKVLHINPNLISAYNNIGNIFLDRGQYDDAIMYYQKAIKLDQNFPDSYISLGNAYKRKRQFDRAMACFRKAIELNPDFSEAYFNLGNTFREKGELDEAIVNYRKALQLNPDSAKPFNGLGHVFHEKGQLDEAELYYRRAIQIEPDNVISHEGLLFQMLYNSRYDAQTIFSAHLRFAKQFAETLSLFISPHTNKCIPNRRLRIGYVSPDFRRHSVAYFVEPVLVSHDRVHFDVFCYSNNLIQDEVTKRIREKTEHWRNIAGISDKNVAELIRKDKIDILIDLVGHTADNRILLFARKPAPIQASWLGYPFTIGLSTIDYKLVDSYTDPAGMTERFYAEKLIRLPESFLCYLPENENIEVGNLPALTTGHITFGSFNNFAKVSPEVIVTWLKILKVIPDSHFILKANSFSDKSTRDYAMDLFIKEGIAAERVELLLWQNSSREHLEAYNSVDIGLDTFPYNGTTTTCEALWMGVPVITLAGNTHASRVGVSLLSNIGLTELIANTDEEYVKIAVSLAKDLKRLQSLRKRLRQTMAQSPLTDAKRFTANLEMCYRAMWDNWCKPNRLKESIIPSDGKQYNKN